MKWSHLLNPNRHRPSTALSDFRNEFERDYDRVVFSTPLRRLQDKTQVFPLEQHDAIRTRLTHTIEVSTVARTITQNVTDELVRQRELSAKEAIKAQAIAATCGLVHDLGNPPFGHAGEQAIRDWFEETLSHDRKLLRTLGGKKSQYARDFLAFDGNAQTIRLLCRLQVFGHRSGLNLTFGTLSAALKYVSGSHQIRDDLHERTKTGYFAAEQDLINQVQEKTKTGNSRNPLTYLVEAADDIVFRTVDLEDGIKKGVLRWELLEKCLRSKGDSFVSQVCDESVRLAKAALPDDETFEETHGLAFRIAAIRAMVPAAAQAFKNNYDSIMNGTYHRELLTSSKAAKLIEACKHVAKSRVYPTVQVLRLEIMGRNVVHGLLDLLWEGAKNFRLRDSKGWNLSLFPYKTYRLVSANYRKIFEEERRTRKHPENYLRLRLITDQVAGMTDTFACTVHRQLTNG